MQNQQIYVIGYEELVQIFGLLGIRGKTIENSDNFLKEFNNLIKQPSIGILIIAIDLPNEILDFLIEFKLIRRRPFLFLLPNIFKPYIDAHDALFKRISSSINKIIF